MWAVIGVVVFVCCCCSVVVVVVVAVVAAVADVVAVFCGASNGHCYNKYCWFSLFF